MRVEATALRAPLEKATTTPWPLLGVLFLEDIFGCLGRAGGRLGSSAGGKGLGGFKPRQPLLILKS